MLSLSVMNLFMCLCKFCYFFRCGMTMLLRLSIWLHWVYVFADRCISTFSSTIYVHLTKVCLQLKHWHTIRGHLSLICQLHYVCLVNRPAASMLSRYSTSNIIRCWSLRKLFIHGVVINIGIVIDCNRNRLTESFLKSIMSHVIDNFIIY